MNIKHPDYQKSIVNVSNSILKHFNVPTFHPTLTKLDNYLNKISYQHVVYMLLDGLGYSLIKEHLPISAAMRKHLVEPITSVFPSTTVAATTSVLSGKTPLETGHIGWVQYIPEEKANLTVFPNVDFYTGKEFKENLEQKYMPYTSILSLIKKQNNHIQTREFFPSFRKGGSNSFQEEIERLLLFLHNTDYSFSYVYWTEPDFSVHQKGTNHEDIKQLINNLNQEFTLLINNLPPKTIVILIADHGLTNVNEIKLFNYKELLALLKQKPSIEPRATSFFVQKGKEEEFKTLFNFYFSNDFKLYTRDEFFSSNLLGPGSIHPQTQKSLGDFISVALTDKLFTLNKESTYKAHHAGLTEEEMIVPLIVVTKP
jgi:hypothetical protein